MKNSKLNKYIAISFGSLFFCIIALYKTFPQINNVLILDENNTIVGKQIPFYGQADVGNYFITGEINNVHFQQKKIKVRVDDCLKSIEINNKIFFYGYDCSRNPINLNLTDYLDNQKNTIQINIENTGGDLAIFFKNNSSDWLFTFLIFAFVFFFTSSLYLILKKNGLPKVLIIILILGMLIRFRYLAYTDFFERDHDNFTYTGHLGYIQYIAKYLSLPNPNDGWEYHQAPLYYIVASFLYKISNYFNFYNTIKIQQFLNILFFLIFLYFSLKIFQQFFKGKLLYLASFLLIFWPSGIIHSIRISNDVMFYMWSVMSMFCLIKWCQKLEYRKTLLLSWLNFKYLFFSTVFASLAIVTKSTGLISIVTIIIVIFLQRKFIIKTPTHLFWWNKKNLINLFYKMALLLFIVFLGLIISFYKKIVSKNSFAVLLNSPSVVTDELRVNKQASSYLYFDFKSYLTESYAQPWNDSGGRNYFWVYFLKSSLLGEFNFQGNNTKNITFMLYFLLLILISFFVIGFINIKNIPLATNLAVSLIALVTYRIVKPFSCNQDFRFILPVLIPFIFFALSGLKISQKKQNLIYKIGLWSCLLFISLSIVFFFCIE